MYFVSSLAFGTLWNTTEAILRLKDIFNAVDVKDAVSQGIKAAPDLFLGAAAPTAAGTGAALLLGGHAVAPAALLALGCGLAAQFVQKLMAEISDRLSKRRSAQFLAYPFYLEKALSKVDEASA